MDYPLVIISYCQWKPVAEPQSITLLFVWVKHDLWTDYWNQQKSRSNMFDYRITSPQLMLFLSTFSLAIWFQCDLGLNQYASTSLCNDCHGQLSFIHNQLLLRLIWWILNHLAAMKGKWKNREDTDRLLFRRNQSSLYIVLRYIKIFLCFARSSDEPYFVILF